MDDYGYGLWLLVLVNSAIFIIFALSFFHPRTRRDWKAMGAFSAFIVALFAEMYGFPLTIYLISGWLGSRFPGLSLTHGEGHLWNDLIGWTGDPHLSPFHIGSYVLVGAGFWVITTAWLVLWGARRGGRLAVSGPYARLRHPQYAGFLLIMVGFLLQWPTMATLAMFPVLVLVYRRLAIGEEREARQQFGAEWDAYAARTPRFLPRVGGRNGSRPDPRTMYARDRGFAGHHRGSPSSGLERTPGAIARLLDRLHQRPGARLARVVVDVRDLSGGVHVRPPYTVGGRELALDRVGPRSPAAEVADWDPGLSPPAISPAVHDARR